MKRVSCSRDAARPIAIRRKFSARSFTGRSWVSAAVSAPYCLLDILTDHDSLNKYMQHFDGYFLASISPALDLIGSYIKIYSRAKCGNTLAAAAADFQVSTSSWNWKVFPDGNISWERKWGVDFVYTLACQMGSHWALLFSESFEIEKQWKIRLLTTIVIPLNVLHLHDITPITNAFFFVLNH